MVVGARCDLVLMLDARARRRGALRGPARAKRRPGCEGLHVLSAELAEDRAAVKAERKRLALDEPVMVVRALGSIATKVAG